MSLLEQSIISQYLPLSISDIIIEYMTNVLRIYDYIKDQYFQLNKTNTAWVAILCPISNHERILKDALKKTYDYYELCTSSPDGCLYWITQHTHIGGTAVIYKTPANSYKTTTSYVQTGYDRCIYFTHRNNLYFVKSAPVSGCFITTTHPLLFDDAFPKITSQEEIEENEATKRQNDDNGASSSSSSGDPVETPYFFFRENTEHFQTVCVGDNLFIFGGMSVAYGAMASDEIQCLNLVDGSFNRTYSKKELTFKGEKDDECCCEFNGLTPMPFGLARAICGVWNNCIYVFGGVRSNQNLHGSLNTEVLIYDITHNCWKRGMSWGLYNSYKHHSEFPPSFTFLRCLRIVNFQDKFYLFNTPPRVDNVYNPKTNTWEYLAVSSLSNFVIPMAFFS